MFMLTRSRYCIRKYIAHYLIFWNMWKQCKVRITWWRNQILALCAGNSPVSSEFPAQRLVMRSFDVFFDLRLNKLLSKQSWVWWFETPLCSLWRHCNETSWFLHYGGVVSSWFMLLSSSLSSTINVTQFVNIQYIILSSYQRHNISHSRQPDSSVNDVMTSTSM